LLLEAAAIARRLGTVLMEPLKINRQRARVLELVMWADWGIRFPPPPPMLDIFQGLTDEPAKDPTNQPTYAVYIFVEPRPPTCKVGCDFEIHKPVIAKTDKT